MQNKKHSEEFYNVANARENFTDVLNQAKYGKMRIKIVKRNKAVAYIVPVEDVEILEKLEEIIDIEDILKAKKEAEETGYINWDEIKKDLGL